MRFRRSLSVVAVVLIGLATQPVDASEVRPRLVDDINQGQANGLREHQHLSELTNVNGTLFFEATDGAHGWELWKSDGTKAGTLLVQDINKSGASRPTQLTNVGGTLFFSADDGSHGFELWRSDGTRRGTVLIKDFSGGDSHPSNLTHVGGTLFITLDDYPDGYGELWMSDGTRNGTALVKDLGLQGFVILCSLTAVGGTLFFEAAMGPEGSELWASDGSEAGTVLLKAFPAPSDFSYSACSQLSEFTIVGGTLFFSADDGTHGFELWSSDGSEAGTVLVRDINPEGTTKVGSSRNSLAEVGGTLLFTAQDGTHGNELWKSDGTATGTLLVKDISPGVASSGPFYITDVGGTAFFAATGGTGGEELWKSDGTEEGTIRVRDIRPSYYPYELTNVGGTLFFSAYNGEHYELWQSDGTRAGTVVVRGIQEEDRLGPRELTALGGTLYFTLNDGVHGRELWRFG